MFYAEIRNKLKRNQTVESAVQTIAEKLQAAALKGIYDNETYMMNITWCMLMNWLVNSSSQRTYSLLIIYGLSYFAFCLGIIYFVRDYFLVIALG